MKAVSITASPVTRTGVSFTETYTSTTAGVQAFFDHLMLDVVPPYETTKRKLAAGKSVSWFAFGMKYTITRA